MSNTITTTTSSPTLTFADDSDTGMWSSSGDLITITAGGAKKPPENYKKVHVARRRQAKKLGKPMVWGITNASPTTLTITQDP